MLEKSTTSTHPAAVLFCLLSLLLMVAVIIGGCAPKRDREIANSAATIHEAITAAKGAASGIFRQDEAIAAPLEAAEGQAEAIADAVGYQLPAVAVADDPRPVAVPAATAQQWSASPAVAAEAASIQAEQTKAAPAGISWGAVGALLAAGIAALARFHPAGGALAVAVGGIRDLAWALATPRHVREAEEARDRLAQAMRERLRAEQA